MSEQQQQSPIQVYQAHDPSEASKRVNAVFDDMESKQIDNLNDAGKSLIERIATFLAVLFGLSILNNNFPPYYLIGNTLVKALLIAALAGYLLAIGSALYAAQVGFYNRYTYNATRSQVELEAKIRRKVDWLRAANVLFAVGTIMLAIMLIVIIWNL